MAKEPYIGHLFKLRCSKCVEVDHVEALTINDSEVLRYAIISNSNYLYLWRRRPREIQWISTVARACQLE